MLDRSRHALGGHTFVQTVPFYGWYRCVRCHGVAPTWALTDPRWRDVFRVGRWCPDYSPPLENGPHR